MTPAEFRNLLALIWGQHGAQAAAARHLGVSERAVRHWAAGARRIPDGVQRELLALASRVSLPGIQPPPDGSTADDDRDDDCADALAQTFDGLLAAADAAGWTRAEVLTAILALTLSEMRRIAGDAATRNTLASAILLLDD